MGAPQRAVFFGVASKTDAVRTKAWVVDGCASLRNLLTRPSTPKSVARMGLNRWSKRRGIPDHTAVFFDIASRMPIQRKAVGAARSKGAVALTPKEAAAVAALKLGTPGPGHASKTMPWDLILRTSQSKRDAWSILAQAVFAELCARTSGSVYVKSEAFTASRGVCGAGGTVGHYGEADHMVAEEARRLATQGISTTVFTCDYDMILQSMVFVGNAERAQLYVQFPKELLDTNVFTGRFGDRNHQLTAALFLLAACSSDYSKPICRKVGMTVKAIVALMTSDAPPCLREDVVDGKRRLTLHAQAYARQFRKPPPVDAVCKHLWTILYFSGYDSGRTPAAGPTPIVLPADIAGRSQVIVYTETHPA